MYRRLSTAFSFCSSRGLLREAQPFLLFRIAFQTRKRLDPGGSNSGSVPSGNSKPRFDLVCEPRELTPGVPGTSDLIPPEVRGGRYFETSLTLCSAFLANFGPLIGSTLPMASRKLSMASILRSTLYFRH